MPSKQVTFQGVMTWDETTPPGVQPPLFPSNPIAPGGMTPPWGIHSPPVAGVGPGFPTNPIAPGGPPLGMWGPGSPIMGNPIGPGGTTPPWGIPEGPGGGAGSTSWEWAYSPVYGWIIVPAGGGGKPQPPGGEGPEGTPKT